MLITVFIVPLCFCFYRCVTYYKWGIAIVQERRIKEDHDYEHLRVGQRQVVKAIVRKETSKVLHLKDEATALQKEGRQSREKQWHR